MFKFFNLYKTVTISFLFLLGSIFNSSNAQVSLAFKTGFFGTQGNNSNSTTGNLTFATLGISSVSFGQPYNGQFGANAGTQGNDLAGTVKIYLNSGQVISLNGALNFRNNGNTRDIFGFIFDPGQNASFSYGNGQTFNIVSGTTAGTSTSLGLRSYSSTYVITSTFGGNAATNGLLDALNEELRLTPQPSTISLSNTSVTEGQNLIYNVTLSSTTAANNPQVYTITKGGTSTLVSDYNTTFTFSDGVTENGDGTITVPGGVRTFSITVSTIDDVLVEPTETLILNIGSKSATGNILDNEPPPALTVNGTLKTFTSCSGCIVDPQSFTVSGVYLTSDIIVTAPTGVQVSTSLNGGYASSINITPTSGTITTTTVYAKLTNNASSVASSTISVTSTGAASKTVTVTTNTDNALSFNGSSNGLSGSKVQLGNSIFTDGQSDFTIEFWMKPTDGAEIFRGMIGAQVPGSNSTRVPSIWQYGRKLHFDIYESNATTSYGGFTVDALNIGQWNHVVYYKNGTSLGFYINGSPVNIFQSGYTGSTESTRTVPNTFKATSTVHYTIGAVDNFFAGAIDDVRFWNNARTSAQITNNMYTELVGNESGLLANLQFNQGTIGGTTSGITISSVGSLNLSPTTSTSINILEGIMPSLTSSSNSFTVPAGASITLSNGLSGGSWSSATTGVASVNSNGVVSAISSGTTVITYSICSKTVTATVTVTQPTITTTGTLKTFTSCSGCSIPAQNFTVSGTNLGANVIVTAPTGFEVSDAFGGTYSSTLTLSQSAGTLSSTTVYVRLINNASTAVGGNFNITSTGATSRTIAAVVNTDNALMFDGSGDYVNLGDVLDISSSAYTKEAWVYWKGSQNAYTEIITKDVVNAFAITNDNKLHTNFGDGTNWTGGYNSTSTIPLNKWTHVAMTRSSTGAIKMYINGVLDQSTFQNSTTGSTSSATVIGAKQSRGSTEITNYFNGSIDNVRVWNIERSSSDITDNLYTELVGNETGLLANYNFNQGIAGGTNTSINTLIDNGPSNLSGTIIGITLTGTSSNFVSGSIPEISAAGNTTTVVVGGTLSLTNSLTGGVWSSSNTNIATINSSSGLITGISGGNTTLSYTICGKVVSYDITVLVPTLTTTSLKTFTSCSGCSIPAQTLTVSGTNLGANVLVAAPVGFEVSSTEVGTYSSSLTLTPTSGTLSSTNVYARLINSASSATSGNFTVTSTGAATKTINATVNTDNALNFDGVDDFVNIPDNSALDLLTAYTIEAWVKPASNVGAQVIIGKIEDVNTGNAADLAYALRYNNGVLIAEIGNGSGAKSITTNNLVVNKWQHIAMVYNGSNSGSLSLYIDGVQQGSTLSTGYTSLKNVTTSLKFGSYGTFFNQYYKGLLDNVKIWNTTKTQSEISAGMHAELSGNETGLVAYYNFNQGIAGGSNTSISSLSGRTATPYNGTLNNFARSGTTSNFVAGVVPEITGESIVNFGVTTTLTNVLNGGTWSSSTTGVATVDASGVVTGISAGTATISYTICDKTVSKSITVVTPTITTSGTLNIFNTCLGTASSSQTFTVSAQYLTSNLVLTAPAGYELSTSSGGTYSTTLSIVPTSGSVSARLIYVRLSASSVNGQSGNITISSTDAVTKNIATGIASVTRTVAASVTISSSATNNTICAGTNVVFTATPTNGGTTPTYQWKLNGNNITGANSATYSTTTLTNNDVITVLMGSSLTSCVTGTPATSNSITTTVTSIPATPGIISGLTTICLNSNQVYSVAAVTGATSYTWVVNGNIISTVSSTTNVINITAANTDGSGTLEVFANNACGTSVGSATLSITVDNNPAPTASFDISPISGTICLSSPTATFTNTSSPNSGSTLTAYNWNFGDGSTQITTANATRTYTSSGIYDVVMTVTSSNNCTSSFSSRITVDPASVAGTATAANTTICEGTNTILTLSGNTGTIQWQQSSDNISFTDISGATSASYNTGNLTATNYYRAVVTSGSCSSTTSGVVTVTVSPTPSVILGQVANVYANATSFNLTYNNTIGSPDEYSISAVAPNAMPSFNTVNNFGLLGSPISVTIPQSSVGTYNFNLTVKNGALGCSSANIPFTLTVVVTPPANLVYNSPNVYLTGSPITSLIPSNDGGVITNYSVGPSLPPGLTIDPTTGVISGTPTATSPQTTYTVTGTNASGTITATLVITVNVDPPASLSYTTPNVYTDGTLITALNPNSTGGPIAQYTVSPNLPSGLTIDPSTGLISGTPSGTSAQTSYVVTGTNASGTISATVVITVNGAVGAPVVQSQTEYCEQIQTSEYKYAKVVFSNTKNLSSANSIQVAEWKWFNDNTEISRTNVTITNPGGSNPSGETPSNIYDGSNATKWLDFNIKTGNNTSTLIFAFPGSGARISSYSWVTANDSEERDPKSWTVYMSNDNVNWTEMHTVSNYTAPSSRFTATNSWSFANASSPVTLSATSVSGYSLRWYTAASGGTPSTTAPTLNTSVVGSTTYYVSQINQTGYETPRSVLTVNVNALPAVPVVSNVNYMAGATANQLTATNLSNHTLKWYTVSSGGTSSTTAPTPSTNSVGTVNYYVSQLNDATGCEGPRGTIIVTTSVAAPSSLLYSTPNVYTIGTTITSLNPTSTGGTISSYTISPSLPSGLTFNTSNGVISGNPSVISAQTTYVVTGTNASGTVSTTIVLTVNTNVIPQPQGSLNAVDYGLLATDTVNLKMSITNGTAPFTLILNNSVNSTKDTITDLTPVNNEVTFKLKRLDTTKVFTIFKLIDANNNTRTSGFTKDTTRVNVLKPRILLTLKAEPTVKQADNSFKTRLLLKVKNSGDLDLRNVQVNANLSSVFPTGINYVLDSVRVLAGNFALNPNYTGAGSATSASSTQFTATASANGSKQSFATLDQNYLFNNGVSLNKDEEGEVVYYVSIGATTQNVTLKLQFESAGDGVLVKNDGTSSAQGTTSASDDGTNIDQHPDLTNNGVPAPTYVPLFPNEKVGASLSVSSSTPVTGGYEFHFVAKIKNYGNVNLDSIRIEYDLNNMYLSPDQAVLISNPTITRGNIVYNAATFDGVNDINLFDYGGKLEVGDSATYEYDLKVTTSRTTYTWPNYFVVYARSINSGLIVNDTSMAGSNPDPNNDNDPLERFFTNVTISYEVPAPPVVENKTYVFGTTIPANIGGLVKSTPTGTIPVWCNEKTAACSVTPPSTPTEIGRYIFALRSYDTTTLLYSDVLVYDTIIIKPPVPLVMNKKYIIGNTANPNNVSGQVTGLVNSTLKYFRNATLQTSIPTLGNTAGVTRYTTSQTVNSIESDTVGFTVTMLDPTTLLHLQKIASEPRLLPNSSFNITYTFLVRNRSEESMTNILVADNLQNTFPSPTLFEVTSVSSTGGLVFNNAFNGKTDIQLLRSNSVLAANTTDTIRLTLNLQPKGYTGTVNNVAVITATTPYGSFSMNSSSTGFANETVKTPTPLTIPDLKIDIPEAFSPNRDGVNDRFVIVKPFGTTLELEVYNRWGNVVYYNANYNNEWDGRGTNNFIGQDLMDGGYYYTLKTKSANGNSQIFKGFVLIQR